MDRLIYHINKTLEQSIDADDQVIIKAAEEILRLSAFTIKYLSPNFDTRKLEPVGVVRQGGYASAPSLEQEVEKKLGIKLEPNNYLPVLVPTNILGAATYVIFEILKETPKKPQPKLNLEPKSER